MSFDGPVDSVTQHHAQQIVKYISLQSLGTLCYLYGLPKTKICYNVAYRNMGKVSFMVYTP